MMCGSFLSFSFLCQGKPHWLALASFSGILPASLGAGLMVWAHCPGRHEHLWKALEWLLILLTQHWFVGKPQTLSSLLLPQPASLLALKAEEHRAWTNDSQCRCAQKPDSSGLEEAAEGLDARSSSCSADHISRQVLSSESLYFAALLIPAGCALCRAWTFHRTKESSQKPDLLEHGATQV